jgi:antitoxin (DNA-binding transcriptional repressor) of toxin-antitoxin stability system
MAIYKLSYAEEHLAELFQAAHDGDEVFIIRLDGLSCQLIPTAAAMAEEMAGEVELIPKPLMGGELVPALRV